MKFNIRLKARVDNRSIDATVHTKANIGPTVITFDALATRYKPVYIDPPMTSAPTRAPVIPNVSLRENAKTWRSCTSLEFSYDSGLQKF